MIPYRNCIIERGGPWGWQWYHEDGDIANERGAMGHDSSAAECKKLVDAWHEENETILDQLPDHLSDDELQAAIDRLEIELREAINLRDERKS